jgi:hypothetical protein
MKCFVRFFAGGRGPVVQGVLVGRIRWVSFAGAIEARLDHDAK